MKLTPLSKKHHEEPNQASRTPPTAGPTMRAPLNIIEFKAMALSTRTGSVKVSGPSQKKNWTFRCQLPGQRTWNGNQGCREVKVISTDSRAPGTPLTARNDQRLMRAPSS